LRGKITIFFGLIKQMHLYFGRMISIGPW
jgi:hypothetical protein